MSDREWGMFFDLMEKAINLPGMSADEKGQMIRQKAESIDQDGTLEEFLAQAATDD